MSSASDTLTAQRDTTATALARRIANDRGLWEPYVRFDAERRWYGRLPVDGNCEVWLLTWLPGQRTGIHDHGGSAGAFAIAAGSLQETVAHGSLDSPRLRVGTYCAGDVRPFGKSHIHDVGNVDDVPAVSVHVYEPSLTQMTRYRLYGGRLHVTEHDRAGAAW